MDPLSVSASVAGLITLAELIVSRGYEFLKGVKNAKAEITKLLVEITALFGVLQSLRLVALRFEGQQFNTILQLDYLQSCQKLVDRIHVHLKAALPEDSDGRWRAAGKSLRWPLSDKETKALIADVGKHKATLSLALNADGLNALLEVLNQQNGLRKGQDKIRDSIEHIQEELEGRRLREEIATAHRKRHKLLKEWTSIDPELQHAAAFRLRHPGTGEWFLEGQKFKSFLEGRIPAMWLYGIPGAGKTVLSSSIIEMLKARLVETTTEGLAYFYCDYKDTATQQADNIIKSLVKHVATQNERSCEDLQALLGKYKRNGTFESTLSISTMVDIFLKMVGHYDCFYVVVDALDECPDDHRYAVLAILKLISTKASNARVIYTSREETDIKESFAEFKSVRITANTSDLELYVASEIQMRTSSGRLKVKHSEVKDKIIDKLTHEADGMFRWVACQLDYLCELPNDKARIIALKTLPPNLFETYERILERIMARSEDVQKIVERTLRWTIGAAKRLTIPELIEAIAIEEAEDHLDEYAIIEEEEIFRHCSCLVRKAADADCIELAHFTVEEFLKAIDPGRTPRLVRFAYLKETADVVLGRTCLTYLTYDDFAKAKIQEMFWLSKNPFWTYAATQWHEHIAKEWDNEVIQGLMRRLFHYSISPHFVVWNRFIWLHSHNMLQHTGTKNTEEIYREWNDTQFAYVDSIIPLHQAAFLALEGLTQWLVCEGSDPNKTSIMGTPLECALSSAVSDDQEESATLHVILILLKFNASIHLTSEANDGKSLLALAVKTENPNLIRAVLDAGATIDMSCIELIHDRMSRKRSSGKALPIFLECISDRDIPASIKPSLTNLALNYRSTTEKGLTMLEKSSVPVLENAELLDLTLSDAALQGQTDVVARTIPFLINSVSSRSGDKERTALHCACMNGHYDIVCLLLTEGADVNVQDEDGNTPAHLCIEAKVDLKILESLIAHGTGISIVNKDRMNLLHLAAQSGRPDVLAFLLSKDPMGEYRYMRAQNGNTLVICALASEYRTLEMIRLAGDAISISECLAGNEDGETGLHLATKMIDVELMGYFLDKGNLNERTSNGSTALHLAFTDGNVESAKLLLDRGADICITTNDGDTPLHLATFNYPGDLDTILSAQGIETVINKRDENGRTAIHIALNQQHFTSNTSEMMEKLLKIPTINVNVTDGDHTTPLIRLAIRMGAETVSQNTIYDAIELLLRKDVDLGKQDKTGSTALHRLCNTELTEIVATTIELLVDKGIDVLVQNNEGSLAVEIMLQNIELSNQEAEPLSDPQIRILGKLLRRIPDESFNALNRGLTRPFVFALQHKAKALAEELAPRTLDVDLSYAEYTSALCPLDACCAYECDFRIFEMLASRSKDLSKKNDSGNTLLHLACYYNKGDIFEYLLARKVDIEVEDNMGSTPLNLSLTFGHPVMMEALLDAGANPAHLNRGLANLWHTAASSPSPEILERLFQKGKIVELEARNSFGYTPLMCAIAAGRKENMEKLLAHNAKLNAKDDSANGVLHLASIAGSSEILKTLIQRGPFLDINGLNGQGQSPLLLAAANGHHTSVAILLAAGGAPDIKDEDDQTVTHHVALCGQTGILIRLKSEHVAFDLEVKNNLGRTPLLCAAEKGHALMVGHLLDEGASIHAVGTDGFGLLHLAAYYGKASVISTVFLYATAHGSQTDDRNENKQHVVDINARHPIDGNTPLGIAAAHGHLAAFEALLDNGADLKLTNHQGWNTLHIAAVNKKRGILKVLFDHCELWSIKLDVNARDKEGRTALMLLEKQGAEKGIVKYVATLLIGKGAKRLKLMPEEMEKTKETEWWDRCGGLCNIDGL